MNVDLISQWRADIVGEWVEHFKGVDLLFLEPVTGRGPWTMSLRADGTATTNGGSSSDPAAEPPFPETWELSDDRILTLAVPIPPMPEYGMPAWSRERQSYDVLALTDLSLTLSDRRFDGETVTVWRRVNADEHFRRKAAQLLDFAAARNRAGSA